MELRDTGTTAESTALFEFLRDRDVFCPGCGYNLRGLTSNRCPECGRDLRLCVGTVKPSDTAWLVLAVSTLAPAGIGLLCLVVFFRDHWRHMDGWLFWGGLYFICCIALAAGALVLRRRFTRLHRRLQWCVSIIITTISAGMVAWFLFEVR